MDEQANVASIEAIDAFRNQIAIFADKAGAALNNTTDRVARSRAWVHTDRRTHWMGERKRRAQALEQAEAELYSARLSEFIDNVQTQRMAVNKAKTKLEEAEAKLAKVKKWSRDFDHSVEPLNKKVENLHSDVEILMPKAMAFLDGASTSLRAYADLHRPSEAASAPSEVSEDKTESEEQGT